ncbi:MAG: hypothetical protein M1816_007809 [Peltula sp. TS41687]|nr:MAG: hypothetical protein M1816_007809 [Peltula sp. TS41687]
MNLSLHEWIWSPPTFVLPRSTTTTTTSTNTASYTPPPTLQSGYRPCMLTQQPTLVQRMLDDLQNLLDDTPNPPAADLPRTWERICQAAARQSIGNEADVTTQWERLSLGLDGCLQELGVVFGSNREIYNVAVNIRMDIALNKLTGEDCVAIECKRDAILGRYQEEWNGLAGVAWLGWNGTAHAPGGGKSILIKLALWMAVKRAQWGLIVSAHRFRVILLLYHRIEDRQYPYLVMSDDVAIDSNVQPIFHILLYMFLKRSQVEPAFLSGGLPITLPQHDPYRVPEKRTRSATQAKMADKEPQALSSVLEETEMIAVCFPRHESGLPGRVVTLCRLKTSETSAKSDDRFSSSPDGFSVSASIASVSPSTSWSPPSLNSLSSSIASHAEPPAIMVEDPSYKLGGSSMCYRGRFYEQEVVMKFALVGKEDSLVQEARVYESHGSHLQHPVFYGLFKGEDYTVIVMEWRGEQLDDFDSLEQEQRKSLFEQAGSMHRHGLAHGDLEPRNITRMLHDNAVTIVDFSHAIEHDCPGEKECEELQHFARELRLV